MPPSCTLVALRSASPPPTRALALAVIAGLAALGCAGGGGEAATTTTAGVDAAVCELLPIEAVTALFAGAEAQIDPTADYEGARACAWRAQAPAVDDDLLPTTHLLQLQVQDGAASYNDDLWGESRPIPGVGDQAFVVDDGVAGATVGMRTGDQVAYLTYGIVTGRGSPAEHVDELVALMERIAREL